MIDATALRARLDARIAQAERLKIVRHTEDDTDCQHEFNTYKQTVRPDSPQFGATSAYFIVRACPKCHTKRVVDYIVER